MIEKPLKLAKLPKLSMHSDRIFRLLWIRDLLSEPTQNYYKVLFQDINSGMYVSEDIFPEYLHDHFSIGLHYRDSTLVEDIAPVGKVYPITFEASDHNRTCAVSEVLTDSEYNLSHSFNGKKGFVDYSVYNKSQRCVVVEDDKTLLIFPCPVIGARFYFLSTSIRRCLFSQGLKGLYDYVKLDQQKRYAQICLRSKASLPDALYITRFATNDFALSRWKAVHASMIRMRQEQGLKGLKKDSLISAELDFPVKQVLNMEVRGLQFRDAITGKTKILVFEILQEDSSFDFDLIDVQYKDRLKNPGSANKIHTRTYQTRNQLTTITPSKLLSPLILSRLQEERNVSVTKIVVRNIAVIDAKAPVNSETPTHGDQSAGSVDISPVEGDSDAEKSAREAEIRKRQGEGSNADQGDSDGFNLQDFTKMVRHLIEYEGVDNLDIIDEKIVPARRFLSRTNKFPRKEYYMDALASPRRYKCASFTYVDLNAYLVEIDHTQLPNGPGTYALVSQRDMSYLNTCAVELVDQFIRNDSLEDSALTMSKNNVLLFSKHHPQKKQDDFYIRWCGELLRKIKVKYDSWVNAGE